MGGLTVGSNPHSPASHSTAPLLEVVDLQFTHIGQTTPTITEVNLTLEAGELVAIAGATGSGKSTLLSCIAGIAPTHTGGQLTGHIYYQGTAIDQWSIAQRSQYLGVLLQNVETQIFTDRVWDELVFGLENRNLPPVDIRHLAQAALHEFDIAAQRDWSIRQLSAGQKQRLLLACLLTARQPILLLDEPFAFLDTAGVQVLLQLLQRRINQGQAVLLIEHRLELVQYLRQGLQPTLEHRIHRIEHGRLINPTASVEPAWNMGIDLAAGADSPDAAGLAPVSPTPFITLQTHNVSYGGYPAFPDLKVDSGEVVLLKGDNGCGKTTLLKLIAGLIKPRTGSIEILGRDMSRQSVVQIAQRVGFVLQNPNHQLFAETVEAEVLQPSVLPEQATAILAQMNLTASAEKHPHALSQGQKRRLALAAVLARQPKLCLLDEIMVGQDPTSLTLMLKALNAYTRRGGTLIFTSHEEQVAHALHARIVAIRP